MAKLAPAAVLLALVLGGCALIPGPAASTPSAAAPTPGGRIVAGTFIPGISLNPLLLTLTGDQKLAVYVDLDDGAGPKAFAGDPRGITLRNHEIITLEITPPSVTPPPSFSWPSGF